MLVFYLCILTGTTMSLAWSLSGSPGLPSLERTSRAVAVASLLLPPPSLFGNDSAQHWIASVSLTDSTETDFQLGLVSTSWAMQEGEKTAVTLFRLRRREAPRSWMLFHWLGEPGEEDMEEGDEGEVDIPAMLSAYSWKVSNCHWKMNRGAERKKRQCLLITGSPDSWQFFILLSYLL